MKKPSDPGGLSVSDLIGLGSPSARKSYYPELTARMAELEAFVADITEREHARQRLMQLNEQLEARAMLPPDVLLVDLHLDDGLTGQALIQRLRAQWQCPQLPAVIVTADRSDHCIQLLRAANLLVLNKPLKPGKLRAVLSQLLGQAH